jgi:hypothetical protein
MRRALIALLLALGLGAPAAAQTITALRATGASGTLNGVGSVITLTNTGGLASMTIQTLDSYSGTWEAQCSLNGTTFDEDDELLLAILGGTTAATEVTDAIGVWQANISGCVSVRVIATGGFAASDTAVLIQAITPGGGTGGGGGGGGGAVDITAVGGNPVTTNVPVQCSNCSGSGASDVEGSTYTLGTDVVAPMGAYADETTPTAATEGRMSTPRLTLNRALLTTERDTADASIFGLAAAGADNTANPTLGGLRTFQYVYDGATWDRWTGAVTNAGTFAVQLTGATNNINNISGTVALPTGASTAANQTTAITALQLIDNLPNTIGSTTSGQSGALGLGAVTTAAPTYTTAQSHPLSLDTAGALRVAITSGAGSGGSSLADNAAFTPNTTSLTVIGGEVDDTSTTAATENSGAAARLTVQRALHVNLRTAAGVELAPATDATHDSAASATGPQIMGEATSALSTDTAVADGDAVRVKTDLLGRQITVAGCGRQDRVRGVVTITDGSSTSALAAQGSGIITEIYEIEIANTSGTDVSVDIRDGTAGSVLWTLMAPATTDTGGGNNRTFSVPLTFTANTAVAVDPSAAATSVIVSVLGCKVL